MCKKKRGFTLVELLVVIAIIALLVSILLPSLQKARELAKRTLCLTNLAGTGKALMLYLNDNYDQYPMVAIPAMPLGMPSKTGTNRAYNTPPDGKTLRSITSLMFLFVREGNDPAIFTCPSDTATRDPNFKDPNTGDYMWDFSGPENVSYSIQAVLSNRHFSNPKQYYMADKNPNHDTLHPLVPWKAVMTTSDLKNNMSPNHQGEMINTLKGDSSSKPERRADIGELAFYGGNAYQYDNIYSTYGAATQASTCRTAITSDPWTGWQDLNDAFLYGPLWKN